VGRDAAAGGDLHPDAGHLRALDEATPRISQEVSDGIPGSQWVLFEESSHMPHEEEPERFRQVVGDFLAQREAARL
jgi:pimeloyl-ACP methyl ester carboxylesterase